MSFARHDARSQRVNSLPNPVRYLLHPSTTNTTNIKNNSNNNNNNTTKTSNNNNNTSNNNSLSPDLQLQ